MKGRTFILGVMAGAITGWLASYVVQKKVKPSPEKILRHIKLILKKEGTITGSWIVCKPEKMFKNEMEYEIYQGGLTQLRDGQQMQYEFKVDANTGTILELKPAQSL